LGYVGDILLVWQESEKPGYRPAFCAESTHNALFSTERLRGIRGALIALGRWQRAKNQPITYRDVEI